MSVPTVGVLPDRAPVVINAQGKKRRPNGQACEAPGCNEFFSSTWYAQNRCCAKSECKRYFGVAGVYQPKKPKGIMKKTVPLADRTNNVRQVEPAPPKPKPKAAAAPFSMLVPPGCEHRPLAAFDALMQRYGGGCFRHDKLLDGCAACACNAAALSACKDAELGPYHRSLETLELSVQQSFLSAQVSFTQSIAKHERRLAVTDWARHMVVFVVDEETDCEVFHYDGPCLPAFDVPSEPERTYAVGLALYGDATEKAFADQHGIYFEPHVDEQGHTRESWTFTTGPPAYGTEVSPSVGAVANQATPPTNA